MTHTVEKPIIGQALSERPLITIEFAPNIHKDETEYSYPHPQFVFGDRVSIVNTYPELEFTVCALELIESKTPSGRLLNQPRWKYKVTNGEVSFWKDETALIRYQEKPSSTTCSTCPHFNNYNESNGRGWCNLHNRPARTHHSSTDDCLWSRATDEAISTEAIEVDREGYAMLDTDSPPSKFQLKSIVKIIDPTEHHTEWGVFEIVEVKNNDHHFDNTDTYLNSSNWLYRLVNTKYEDTYCRDLWVGESEICHFDRSHLICTEEIF